MIYVNTSEVARSESGIPLHIIHTIEKLDRLEIIRGSEQVPWYIDFVNYLAADIFLPK
jgi:hypothetical protein